MNVTFSSSNQVLAYIKTQDPYYDPKSNKFSATSVAGVVTLTHWSLPFAAPSQAQIDALPSSPVFFVPKAVTKRQLKLALLAEGVLPSTVIAAINAGITDPVANAEAMILWEDAVTFERDHPMIAQLAPALGFATTEAINELFINASKL
jgi:hypothetical protein